MAIHNSQMREGRILKLAKGRKLYRRMNECWDRGGFVRIGTATRYRLHRLLQLPVHGLTQSEQDEGEGR
jgi:hypothetical protein